MRGFTLIELLVCIAFAGIFVIIGACITSYNVSQRFQSEAINNGVAEYYIVDSAIGKSEFRWKKASSIIDIPPMCQFAFTNNSDVFIVSIDKK